MPFKMILTELMDKAEANGAVLMDKDGEIVEHMSRNPSIDIDLIGAHHGIILNIARDASSSLDDLRDVKAISINTDRVRLTILCLREGYFLVLANGRNSFSGRSLLEAERAAERLNAELC